MTARKRILALLVVMVGVATAVASLAIWVLYEAAFEQQREQLETLAEHQARMLESSIRSESLRSGAKRLGNSDTPTIGEILRIHNTHASFGQTGEYVIGQREVGLITFLLPYRFPGRANRKPVQFGSNLAQPMHRALEGRSGWMVGRDYGGVEVLAAYAPLEVAGLGLVAKIDVSELRAPFLRAGAITAFGGLVILLLGAIVFRRIGMPLIDNLEANIQDLEDAQCIAQVGSWNWEVGTDLVFGSNEAIRLFGKDSNNVTGSFDDIFDAIHPDDRKMVRDAIYRTLKGKPLDIEHRIVLATGAERTVNLRGEVIRDEKGRVGFIRGTVHNITERKRAEEALKKSEESYRRLYNKTPGMLHSIDGESRLLNVSDYWLEVLGYLTKPIEVGEVLSTIEAALNGGPSTKSSGKRSKRSTRSAAKG